MHEVTRRRWNGWGGRLQESAQAMIPEAEPVEMNQNVTTSSAQDVF